MHFFNINYYQPQTTTTEPCDFVIMKEIPMRLTGFCKLAIK